MKKSDLKEIIKVREDGLQEKVEKGIVLTINEDDVQIEFTDVHPVDIARMAIGLMQGIEEMGLGELTDKLLSYYNGAYE